MYRVYLVNEYAERIRLAGVVPTYAEAYDLAASTTAAHIVHRGNLIASFTDGKMDDW